jgi:hypothetical protein
MQKPPGLLLGLFLLLWASTLSAQLRPQTLRLAIANQTTGLPSLQIDLSPFHPTLNVGTDLRVRSGKHWQRILGLDFYYYYHRTQEHALMLDVSYRSGYRFGSGLQTNVYTALGYKHAILSGEKFRLENGEYQRASHWGKPQFNTKLGLGMEYPLSERTNLMADYKIMIAYPTGAFFVPFSLQNFFGLGLNFRLQTSNE